MSGRGAADRKNRGRYFIFAAVLAGTALPAPAAEKYAIDPTRTYPSLEFSHLGISIWRGKFEKTSGSINCTGRISA